MRTFITVLSLAILAGCSTKHPGTYEVGEASGEGSANALVEEANGLWEKRGDKASLVAALAKYDEAHQVDPTNREVGLRLVRGWYFLGDTHEAELEPKLAAWEKAISMGKSCIAINGEFTALLEKGDETEASAVRVATAEDVPCLYWTASALGKWAKASGLAKTLKHLPTAKAYISRVSELDPSYFHGAPDRYWGAYYAAIPSFAGQDLGKAKQHFDKSIESAPEYFGTQVLLAEYWAVKMQDRATFTETLEKVVAADPNVEPSLAPENTAEQAKATALLAKADDLFAE